MGNPVARSQSLTRQKWNTGQQKWDSTLSNSSNLSSRSSGGATVVSSRQLYSSERGKSVPASAELTNVTRPKFLSGEHPLVGGARPPSPNPISGASTANNTASIAMRDAATNTGDSPAAEGDPAAAAKEAFKAGRLRSSVRVKKEQQLVETKELLPKTDIHYPEVSIAGEQQCYSDALQSCSSVDISMGVVPATTSVQTEKEGSHSRLLSRGGESSSFRGKQISSSSRRESSSFRKETVSSSFRKEVGGSRRKERKATKSFQDGDASSIASESARGSPCSIHYNQAPFSGKNIPPPHGIPWASSPSSPDTGFGKSAVPFQWEEAPGKAKTIAAAAEMALARKLVRDESLRRLNAASPRSSVDSYGSFRLEKKSSPAGSRRLFTEKHQQQEQLNTSATELALPPAKRVSQELSLPRKDSHSSQLIEDLKAAVVRKQAEECATKAKGEVDDDARSVISDYCVGETQIDLVAPAAAKFLNREDDVPSLTPVKTPLAAVPFKWEEAPGKPKESNASPPHSDPPSLSLPPRLLGGCHNPSKEQQAKILQTYSCNLMDMHWTSSGNPTPLSRSRDATPTRRDRTPTRRDRTPTKRDTTPGRREITPTRRDSTPTRSYFPTRVVPKSGPITLGPTVASLESVRDHHSGPLRSNTHPNYLNVPPRSVSQEFARVTQDSALTVLTQDLDSSNRTSSDAGSGTLYSYRSSSKASQELQIVRRDSSPDVSLKRSSDCSLERSRDSSQECRAIVKVISASAVDPLSPTSILCGPDVDSSQRTVSNLSSAYAESSHSHLQETISGHTKSESCTSLESFVDETYNLPPPWSGSETMESPYRDLGPIDLPSEGMQGNKSIEEGVKAIVRFCKKAKKWNKSKAVVRKNSAEPDMWAPTLATYFQKIELGGTILGKVGSQVFPEAKEAKIVHHSGIISVPCSPLKFVPRSGELTATPDRLGGRKPLGSMTPVHVITTCRSPSYRVMATDECFSVFCMGKVWSGTKARHAKWGRKMRRSSRLMGAIFAALKRSMLLKCGRQSLPTIPSDKNLLDRDGEVLPKEQTSQSQTQRDPVHSLSADHQFHRPL